METHYLLIARIQLAGTLVEAQACLRFCGRQPILRPQPSEGLLGSWLSHLDQRGYCEQAGGGCSSQRILGVFGQYCRVCCPVFKRLVLVRAVAWPDSLAVVAGEAKPSPPPPAPTTTELRLRTLG